MSTNTASRVELDLTSVIGLILSNPTDYAGQEVTIVGYYRGWDLLGGAESGPPATHSDWVIKDASGGIHVNARGGFDRALGLDPASKGSVMAVLHLVGTVRVTTGGQLYIEANRVTRLDAERVKPIPGEAGILASSPLSTPTSLSGVVVKSSSGGIVERLSVEDMTLRAGWILVGTVVDLKSEWNNERALIYTYVTVCDLW